MCGDYLFCKQLFVVNFIDYGKAFDCVDHNQLWKILKNTSHYPQLLNAHETSCFLSTVPPTLP